MSTPPTITAASVRNRPRRRIYLIAAAICVLAIAGLLWSGLRGNVVYFRTVSEALHERAEGGDTGRFRIAGEYVPGTLEDDGREVQFDLTDGKSTVTVVHRGDQPTMFRDAADRGEEVPLVVEGNWGNGDAFDSDRLMVKHGNEYTPPDVKQT